MFKHSVWLSAIFKIYDLKAVFAWEEPIFCLPTSGSKCKERAVTIIFLLSIV